MTKTWKEITASRPETPERLMAYEQGRREAAAQIVAYNLAELRKLRSVTQVELARHLGVAQPSLSGLERRGDFQLSTLRDYVEGLGGQLEISAVFDDIKVPVALLFDQERPDDVGFEEAGAPRPARTQSPPSRDDLLSDQPGSVSSLGEEVNKLAKQRRTGTAAARAASKVLRDGRTSATSKRAAGSALSQAAPKRSGKRK